MTPGQSYDCHPFVAALLRAGSERSEGARPTVKAEQLKPWQAFGSITSFRVTLLGIGVFLFTACTSPEATRTRGGGPGADVKNWSQPIELHAGAEPYHDTPCVTEPVECSGPPSVFGPAKPAD
jgi:hypothetical protein